MYIHAYTFYVFIFSCLFIYVVHLMTSFLFHTLHYLGTAFPIGDLCHLRKLFFFAEGLGLGLG